MTTHLAVVIMLILNTLLFICNSDALAGQKKNILILHSYHQGFQWTDDLNKGIIAELAPVKTDVKIFIEYMGSKWAYDSPYLKHLSETYKLKYRHTEFDLIITSDNDAFDFMKQYRNDIFGEKPVVFCGVNWFKADQIKGHRHYTGVNEDADISKNLDLLLKLHPATKHIYAVVDLTTTGNIVHKRLVELMPSYRDRVAIHILDDMELSRILQTVSALRDDSLVLLTVFQKDKAGAFLEYNEIAGSLSENSRVPVYGLWDFYLGHGIVGGLLTSGRAQGESAGKLALRILNGDSADSIPVIKESPNRYLFDYKQMERFNIKPSDLPGDSQIINQPPSFYNVNKGLVWGLAAGMTGLALATGILLINIHRRTLAETAFRKSEERYHTLVDNLTLGVYRNSGTMEGKFIQANPAMARIFGYDSMDEFLNLTVAALYDNPEERQAYLKEINSKGFVKDKEILMTKKDGEPAWISLNAKISCDESGRTCWTDGTAEDITEKKKLEQQLRQAQKMEALGALAGGIAHDFNNILTAIIGYVSLLQMNMSKDDARRSYTDEIMAASKRAATLTKSLLAFSRKQEIVTKAVSINQIIMNFEKFMTRIIGEDIELIITTTPEELVVMADSGQIEQVLMNLATNARDAMSNGGLLSVSTTVEELDSEYVKLHPPLKAGRHVEISISDTGCGMDEATRQRIFEPFFTTKESGKGTGLGLSIIYGIIKQHNGEITVYSEPDRGTTFKIYLPLLDTDADQGKEMSARSARGGSETILLAEDEPAVRKLQKGILEQFGYTVIEAEDGEEAIDRFMENREAIQLVMLDVIMPKKNGKEVYEEISKIRPGIKTLFTSGYTADIISRQGILEKGLHFISKPATPGELARKLREILDSSIQA